MKKFAMAAAAIGALAASLLVGVAPTSAATAPIGYVVIEGDGGCELQQLDLVTGLLTDLPAARQRRRLLRRPRGHHRRRGPRHRPGRGGRGQPHHLRRRRHRVAPPPSPWPATTPSASPTAASPSAPRGTIYVQLVAGIPGCDTGSPDDTIIDEAAPLYEGDSVCLFTLDAGTGVATLVGTTGLFETYFFDLTSCASGLITQFVDSELGGLRVGHREHLDR